MINNEFLNDYYVESFDDLPFPSFEYRGDRLNRLRKEGLTPKKETYLATKEHLSHKLIYGGGDEPIEVEPDNLVTLLTELLIDYKKLQDRVHALEKTVYQLYDNNKYRTLSLNSTGYQPRPHSGTPNPPQSDP